MILNKKIMRQLTIAAILFLMASARSFAGDTVDYLPHFNGQENFSKTFPQAQVINCKSKGELTEVNFTWQGLHIQAYYDKEGTAVATSRDMNIENLPLNAQMNLRGKYARYSPVQAIEYSDGESDLSYFVTVTDDRATLVLHITTDGSISVFKKITGTKRFSKG